MKPEGHPPADSPGVHPLLMAILRGSDPETLLPLVHEEQEWEDLIKDAAAHGCIPLLYRWIKRADVHQRLPPRLLEDLEGQCVGVAALNMVLADELANILRQFEERGLPCVPLRGLALAERLYGDITARPMGDLDLLVRRRDLPAVTGLLGDLGFRELDRRPGFARAFSYTLEFLKDRHGGLVVEPHWTLTYPPFVDRIDMEGVWERCVRGRVVGVDTWLLGREDLLLHLCLHLAHRGGTAPLLWAYELDRLVRLEGEALDWSRVLSVARQGELQFLLSPVLGQVKTLFAAPVPEPVLGQLTREVPRSLEGRLARLLAGASGVDGTESLAAFFALKGFRTRLRYACGLLFPSPEFMRTRYGLVRRRQLGLAYCRRACRLGFESLKAVLKVSIGASRFPGAR